MTIPFFDPMAASLSFSPAASSCDHLAVQYTLTIGGRSMTRTLHVARVDLKQRGLTSEDADAFAELALRVLAEQSSQAGMRTAIGTKVIDLTVLG